MLQTERMIAHVVSQGLPLVLLLTKVDRLIVELKLPAEDAFFKLRHTLDQVNALLASAAPTRNLRLSPELGNVAFASASQGWSFTLPSFAALYAETFLNGKEHVTPDFVAQFAQRLWGENFFEASTRKFLKKASPSAPKRSFVQYVLEPLYKLYSQVP
jgi:116 kDa U5 small nuclear ribonucleoprotein component